MTEAAPANDSYLRKQKEDYATRAASLGQELRARLRSITFGPTYKAVTKKGTNLTMHTYQIPGGENRRIDVLVALDDQGNVVGHKIHVLDEYEDIIEGTNGAIYTAKRGEGIAKPMEMASFHLLQQEADEKQKDIHYIGINRNAEHLQYVQNTIAREQAENKPLTFEPAVVDDLVEESKRWHSLFGPNGSLGFDPLTRKVFHHNGFVEPLDPSSIIEITTEDVVVRERKLTVPHVVSIQPDPIDERTIETKTSFLQGQVLPQLEALAA